ncbi:hypothetical protein F5B20DRAFT_576051 [Whalleya microplaca]|nr:hypothetical protein F5B20DRAFT_576051 [Whalleya microplaca]
MASPNPPPTYLQRFEGWGNSSIAPTSLATLITALHARPLQPRPLLFTPILLFASYANLQGFRIDSAGITAAASGTYAALALRRRPPVRFGVRGAVRASAIAMAVINVAAAGWVYATGDRVREKEERRDNPRWVE